MKPVLIGILAMVCVACSDSKGNGPREETDPSEGSNNGNSGDGENAGESGGSTNGEADAGQDEPDANGGAGGEDDDDAGTSDAALSAALLAKFTECKVNPPGDDAAEVEVRDEAARCSARCIVAGTREDLRQLACSNDPAANALRRCLAVCPLRPEDGHVCTDGSKIPHAALCDGFADCVDGSDERGCGEYVCADGTKVAIENAACDGVAHCRDGSDELDCPAICT